jgi:hypothetical protein
VVPVFSGYTIPRAEALCNSPLGQLGQAFSQQASVKCGEVDAANTIINVLAIAGVVSVVAWLLFKFQKSSGQPPAGPAPRNTTPGTPPPPASMGYGRSPDAGTPPHTSYGVCWCGQVHRQQ